MIRTTENFTKQLIAKYNHVYGLLTKEGWKNLTLTRYSEDKMETSNLLNELVKTAQPFVSYLKLKDRE